MRFLIFFSIVLVVFGSVGYYIYLRISQSIFNSNHSPITFTLLYWFLTFSLFLGYLLQSFSINILSESLVKVGSFMIGVFAYGLLAVVLFDIVRLINHFLPFLPDFITKNYAGFKFKLGIITALSVFSLVIYGYFHAVDTKIVDLKIKINKKINGDIPVNIVALSDIHLGTIINHKDLNKLFDKIRNLNPDIVLIGGDLVDNSYKVASHYKLLERFRELNPKYGIYACLGNHDYISRSFEYIDDLNKNGINILRDTSVLVDNRFYIIGRDDVTSNSIANHRRKSLDQLMENIDTTKAIILLDHQPFNLESVSKYPIDLQFSGHTHKGQFFPFSLITKLIFEKDYGFVKKGNTNFYISSGFGNAVSPIRIGTQSEIVNIKLSN